MQIIQTNHLFGVDSPLSFEVPTTQEEIVMPQKVPQAVPYRFLQKPVTQIVRGLQFNNRPFWLYGPTGTGKTSLIAQMAARLQKPCFIFPCSQDTELWELIGHTELIDGRSVFLPGPLTLAGMMGAWLVLDEGNLLSPGRIGKAINPILDGYEFEVPDILGMTEAGIAIPRTITFAAGFRLFITANDDGSGSFAAKSGYVVQKHDKAFLNRFVRVYLDYMEAADEEAMIKDQVGDQLDDSLIKAFVMFAGKIRTLIRSMAAERKAAPLCMSNRDMLDWVYQSLSMTATQSSHNPMWDAFEDLFLSGVEPEILEPIQNVFADCFGISAASC